MSSVATVERRDHSAEELCSDVDSGVAGSPGPPHLTGISKAGCLRISPFETTPSWLLLRHATAAEAARVVLAMHTDMQLLFFEGTMLEVWCLSLRYCSSSILSFMSLPARDMYTWCCVLC
jgi:hypothetical protein